MSGGDSRRPRDPIPSLEFAKPAHLECRDLGHNWRHHHDERTTSTRGVVIEFVRTLRCTRCKTERVEVIALPSLRRIRVGYAYPDGYRMQAGAATTRTDARREVLRRLGVWTPQMAEEEAS